MQHFFDHLDYLRRRVRPVALATVVGIEGGSSKRVGARLWVTEGGDTFGSLTVGGCVDGRARDEARFVLDKHVSRRIRIDLGEDGLDFGMGCAGAVDVYIEHVDLSSSECPVAAALDLVRSETTRGRTAVYVTPLDDSMDPYVITSASDEPLSHMLLEDNEARCAFITGADGRPDMLYQSFVPPRILIVVGAAPIAQPLVRLGKMLGYRVLMVDGKSERLTKERFPEADELLFGIPSEICSRLSLDERSAVVLTAHDYRYEVPVLKEVLQHETGYVGFVASRRRGGAVLDFLAQSGVDRDRLNRVRVPVGLDIGALTPSEIAVSIMAEVLAMRSDATCLPLVDLPNLEEAAALISQSR